MLNEQTGEFEEVYTDPDFLSSKEKNLYGIFKNQYNTLYKTYQDQLAKPLNYDESGTLIAGVKQRIEALEGKINSVVGHIVGIDPNASALYVGDKVQREQPQQPTVEDEFSEFEVQ